MGETLTFQQICYLHAVISGEKAITSAETMHKYHISSATAASRSLKTLTQKDILDSRAGVVSFQYSPFIPTRKIMSERVGEGEEEFPAA